MTYTTIQGDTWDGIAFKVYGKSTLAPLLLNANPLHTTTVIFDGGIKLDTPAEPEDFTSILPPWKRGVGT